MTEQLVKTVSVVKQGNILVATVDNAPVNALSHSVRVGLIEAVKALESDTEARAMVILCDGRTFIAGADIHEFKKPMVAPLLGEVIDTLDAATKPIVAAIHGTALGGGLEVALACSYRIALEGSKVGLPEVKLGILPGSGGTVRLPRLAGVEQALAMISEGGQISARDAREKGIVDEVVSGDLKVAAVAFAARVIADGAKLRRTSDLPVPAFDPAVLETSRAALAKKYKGFKAPLVAVDLIKMVTETPVGEAIALEYKTCKELLVSPQSKALRHIFAAEREALKIDGVDAEVKPREVKKVAIVGPGTMGRGIAACFLSIGIPVTLIGLTDEGLASATKAIGKIYEGSVKRGSLSTDEMQRRMALLSATTAYDGLGDVDLVIEAVTEQLDVKKDVFAKLDAVLRDDAIIATNTSFLDIEELAASSKNPARVAGMHFFNPANVMKLLENVRAAKTAPDVLATTTALGKRLGKVPVMVGRSEGFVANRMLSKRTREAQFLLEDGATPQQVDRVLTAFGFPIGPFALADLAGMDIMAAARAARVARMSPREQQCNIVDRLVAAGRLGQKSGAGYYVYDENRKASHDPLVDELLDAHRKERGFTARTITDEEILERCLFAMVNEAAKILDESAAARPGDIDVIWTNGFGFPTYLGGPMFYADQVGLPAVKAALDKYAGLVGDQYFKPAALIERLVAEGRGFYG
ncbi:MULTISPECIES: 3-hydroxyacyl-CoA dehydrogenase NAD-binding domain-containing protein [Hyphomicrobiales]|jgi:3-hydroxyacyl-CoA dehydrogenase|uniref:3-hydroxyacyl-CoA dehydrogenase NAD-binding domain-containing protein n=1 Tax=Hyphomicrobiales TaxID=356 RepID=UPI00037541B4|nr:MULTISPECIES: 3-hydroxyacyl-CoA dehydrogenase NAD-binding domain-containing protein [Phyllobacteriaceae]MCX8570096.1 3-hydroxyacyl-CoA dehydrogenase NAD-binding domain-containing protein [Aminobacter sp. MET-1]